MRFGVSLSAFGKLSFALRTRVVGLVAVTATGASSITSAAMLPEHEPFAVLVIADEVNPNQLSDADLTQPGDFAPALQAEDSGLALSAVVTVDSQCADQARDALTGSTPPDVVLYFAHRAAKSCAGSAIQEELVVALQSGLEQSTGIVVFHHGSYPDLYQAGAKDSLLELVGASFEGIAWNTTVGQRVFNVGGNHFVSNNGLTYAGVATFAGVAGVASGDYPYFDNIPDERYPNATFHTQPDEQRTLLFASNSGGERVLGYVLVRPTWQRAVVAYQPGEYQPNALDLRNGNNFQVLANALYFSSRNAPSSVEPVSPTAVSPTSPAPTAPASVDTFETVSFETTPSSDGGTSESTADEPTRESTNPSPPTPPTAAASTSSASPTIVNVITAGSASSSALTSDLTVMAASTGDAASTSEANTSGSIRKEASGCGCRLSKRHALRPWFGWGLLGLVAWALLRRR